MTQASGNSVTCRSGLCTGAVYQLPNTDADAVDAAYRRKGMQWNKITGWPGQARDRDMSARL